MVVVLPNPDGFPFLFGGTFIEGGRACAHQSKTTEFPFLFGGTFIEGSPAASRSRHQHDFPSFSEGLSLRGQGFLGYR